VNKVEYLGQVPQIECQLDKKTPFGKCMNVQSDPGLAGS